MEYKETIQVTDEKVTREKFAKELEEFRSVEDIYRTKGIICTKVSYPDVYFAFGTPKLSLSILAFAVRINFTNYDFEPPSVVFVNPFTHELVRRDQIKMSFIQAGLSNPLQAMDLLQGRGDMIPFFCIPGTREYHNHHAHSGDSWFLYRTKGEGTLLFLIDQLYNHSIKCLKDYQVVMNLSEMKFQAQQEIKFQVQQNTKITK